MIDALHKMQERTISNEGTRKTKLENMKPYQPTVIVLSVGLRIVETVSWQNSNDLKNVHFAMQQVDAQTKHMVLKSNRKASPLFNQNVVQESLQEPTTVTFSTFHVIYCPEGRFINSLD